MKQLRGRNLNAHQVKSIIKVINITSNSQSTFIFDRAFDVAVALDLLKYELENQKDVKQYAKIERKLRGLDNKITPAVKRAAIAREPTLIPLVLQYFRQFNGDTNISCCIKWVRGQGAGKTMQDAAMRARIKAVFGIEGKRGRPLGS